jgi:hypothetical protein
VSAGPVRANPCISPADRARLHTRNESSQPSNGSYAASALGDVGDQCDEGGGAGEAAALVQLQPPTNKGPAFSSTSGTGANSSTASPSTYNDSRRPPPPPPPLPSLPTSPLLPPPRSSRASVGSSSLAPSDPRVFGGVCEAWKVAASKDHRPFSNTCRHALPLALHLRA